MKVLAFGATNSKKSINKELANYVANKIDLKNVSLLDLNEYEMSIYSVDREQESGIPTLAKELFEKIGQSDIIIISFAEHNGTYTAAYKNVFDWLSRIDQKVFQNKKVIYLATSPGMGAQSVLSSAVNSIQYFGGNLVDSLSIPSFYENYSLEEREFLNNEYKNKIEEIINKI